VLEANGRAAIKGLFDRTFGDIDAGR
jgi:hypothetical protein